MLLLPLSSAFSSEVFKTSTEMIQWDPDQAFNGYTLFCGFGSDLHLVDMEGNLINRWHPNNLSTNYGYLMENGNVRVHGNPPYAPPGAGRSLAAGGSAGRIEELDWNGNLIWELDVFDGSDEDGNGVYENASYRNHHDFQRVWNKALGEYTWLTLVWIVKGPDDAAALGGAPQYASLAANEWSPCALMEFRYNGDLVWFWTFADHFVTAFSNNVATSSFTDVSGRINAPAAVLGDNEGFNDYYGKLNINGVHYTAPSGPRTDFQHCNSFDYDDATGHIAINAKAASEFFVIDHDGTFVTLNNYPNIKTDPLTAARNVTEIGALARGEAGDFLYRFGNPSNYASGDAPGYYDQGDQQMFGTHDIQFIRPYHWRPAHGGESWALPPLSAALPGAGNFLMFDNACYDPTLSGSVILEVNPYIYNTAGNEDSDLVDPATAGYKGQNSSQIVWNFNGGINDFYSSYISSCQRLPNGNTLIDSGAMGHIFEVTESKTVVWEYVMPYAGVGFGGPSKAVTHIGQGFGNATFRAHRYGPDYPGLAGQDLSSDGTITGRIAGSVDLYPDPVPAPTGWGTSSLISEGGGGDSDGDAGGGTGGY